jgi:hypothetical protein
VARSDANPASNGDSENGENDGVWQELTHRVASRQKPQKTPEVGFEPTTNRLTADRSTTELLWIAMRSNERR